MNTAAVPVSVTPEAAARVAELGMQDQFEAMLDHARGTVPGLRRIEVTLAPRYETGDEPGVSIEAFTAGPFAPGDRTTWNWNAWMIDTFPPSVCEHFALLLR
jgi:hypothetical protein